MVRFVRIRIVLVTLAVGGIALASDADARLVRCERSPEHSYLLRLPPGYDAEHRWPILYVLDPRGRAEHALDVFREAAIAEGFVVASSYDSRSDTDPAVNHLAIRALLDDTFARIAIDPRRVYVAGFSGTARAACDAAAGAAGGIAGVVAVGAGCAGPSAPGARADYELVSVVGERDFNFVEVEAFTDSLLADGVPHERIVHDGAHAWHPADLSPRVLEWFALRSAVAGDRPVDGDLVERRIAAAEALGDAWERWSATERLRLGLGEEAVRRGLPPVVAGRDVRRESRRRREARRREVEEIARIETVLDALRRPGPARPSAAETIRRLGIAGLRDRAPDDAHAARLLATIRAIASFYLPRELRAAGDEDGARIAEAVGAAAGTS